MTAINGNYRVLLVDDEEEFLSATSQALVRRGLDVEVAPNGVTAIEMVSRERFDLVVLDVRMPDIDGTEVLGIIRSKQPELPVIMLTGHASVHDAFQTSRDGAADYLAKPVDMDELAARIGEVVTRFRQRQGPDLQAAQPVAPAKNIRVMLIDDEVEFLDSLGKVLRRRNLELVTAESGEKGLALLREQLVDVVVLDVKLPGMDGLEVLRRIRHRHPSVQVIILTGHPSLEAAMEAIKLGANEYMRKPPDIQQLASAINLLYEHRQELLEQQRERLIKDIRERFPD